MTGEGSPAQVEEWGLARCLAFRFACVYFLLYFCESTLGLLPWDAPAQAHQRLWHAVVPWVGKHVLALEQPITVFPAGSGDTTYNYVEVLCYLALALGAALLWSLLDRRARHYRRLYAVLTFVLRFVVGTTLIGYGMSKVIQTQFPHLDSDRLRQAYGDSSPMGLLWTFMGYSRGYNLFCGAGETVGGLLLFYRRTTTLGALVLAAVMANVAALNFFFDVPVKLYSSHLLAASAFLALPDATRLWNVVVANRPTAARERTRWPRRWAERLRPWIATAYLGWLLHGQAVQNLELQHRFGLGGPTEPLQGLYKVVGFTRDNEEVSETDPTRWKEVHIDAPEYFLALTNGGNALRYRYHADPSGARITLVPFQPPGAATAPSATDGAAGAIELETVWNDAAHLDLAGELTGALIVAQLEKRTFLLETRGFHWINETPFNR